MSAGMDQMPQRRAADKKTARPKTVRKLPLQQLKKELEAAHNVGIVKDLWKYGDNHLAKSHYRWWWEFVRAGSKDEKLTAELTQNKVTARAMQKVIADFDAANQDYEFDSADGVWGDYVTWWQRTGHHLFKELAVPYINPIEIRVDDEYGVEVPKILLEVPLNISRDLLRIQFDAVIDHYYPDKFMRHTASTAAYKIEPVIKDRTFEFAYLLAVWKLRQEDENMAFWEVHCRVQKDHKSLERLRDEENTSDEREELTKKAERAYKQADELMRNAMLGQFPKDDAFQKAKGRKSRSKNQQQHTPK
jgi:hypothetical protein